MASMQMSAVTGEKSEYNETGNVNENNQAIDQDRDTFLPRPSDDPKDPLNWALSLKVSIRKSHQNKRLLLTSCRFQS